jgi:hypothetical protein
VIVSHEHKFIFLKTQKTGGTSVELALSRICGPDDIVTSVSADDEATRIGLGPQHEAIPLAYRRPGWRLMQLCGFRPSKAGIAYFNHMSAAVLRRAMDPALFDAYRKVTVVRNPWDREVSRYFWHYRKQRRRPSFEYFVRMPRYRPGRKNFDVYSTDGLIVADTVLRYERLAEDFSRFIHSLGINLVPELPRAKAGVRPKEKRDYREFYNATTRRIVARRSALEIAAFGYEF